MIDQIVSSELCISSSLHGLIIAQAYGVPWVWLNLVEQPLDGHDFKFEDFFSTLKDSNQVYRSSFLFKDINEENLIKLGQRARVNNLKYSLELPLDSCPFV